MMSKYRGLYTFDVDNHKYVPVVSANGIVDLLDTTDYVPTEPLIKDKEVRSMVRLWAKIHNVDILCYLKLNGIVGHYLKAGNYTIDIEIESLITGKYYTLKELCGEEEE